MKMIFSKIEQIIDFTEENGKFSIMNCNKTQ